MHICIVGLLHVQLFLDLIVAQFSFSFLSVQLLYPNLALCSRITTLLWSVVASDECFFFFSQTEIVLFSSYAPTHIFFCSQTTKQKLSLEFLNGLNGLSIYQESKLI